MAHISAVRTRFRAGLAVPLLIGLAFCAYLYAIHQSVLPNGGGCDAIHVGHERLISMIGSLKAEIATDLPPEKVVALVWIEVELINSAVDQMNEYAEGCGSVADETRAWLEAERAIASTARLGAIAKAAAALN